MRHTRQLLALVAVGLSLAACSTLVRPDQTQANTSDLVWLSSSHTVGQTIVSEEAGLAGIEVFLEPDHDRAPTAGGVIVLHLRSDPGAGADLTQATLPLELIVQGAYYRFAFPPVTRSLRQDYYALLEMKGDGRVRVGHGPGTAYWQGALYQNGEPAEAQLAFRLVYEPVRAAWGLLTGALRWAWWLLLAALLVIVPGWVLLGWLWPASVGLSWAEQLGLAAGIGCAPYPILLLWTHLIGLRLGPLYAWLPVAVGAVGLGWLARRNAGLLRAVISRAGLRTWWRAGHGWPDLAFVGVMGLVFFTRWWVARPLDLPLWEDSVQHTMIAQLMVDNGGLFSSWAPYAELETFTYHFGFHALVAVFHWLSGLALPQATLWVGQIVNGLAVLALYPVGVRMGGNRWGGVVAVLVAGLLSPHPNYYANWGRYTQLMGQVLLPAAVTITWTIAETKTRRAGLVALGGLVVAGLALTHYRVLLMYGFFVVALLLVSWREARQLIRPLFWLTASAVALALPWMITTVGGPLQAFVGSLVTTPAASVSRSIADNNGIPDPRLYPGAFWLAVALGCVVGWRQRRRATVLVLVWWGLLAIAANPAWLGLPGTGVLSNFAVFIAGYMGAALMAAAGGAWLTSPWLARWRPMLSALVLVAGLWGARQRVGAVDAGRFMQASRPDLRAAAWIDRHLPTEARLLVNTYFTFSGTVAVGGDGGWWLPLMARRAVTTPPINHALERGPRPDYRVSVESLPIAIREHGVDDPVVLAMLRERGVSHVYIGQQRNQPYGGPPLTLQPDKLLASRHFWPVYHEDRVWVFAVVP